MAYSSGQLEDSIEQAQKAIDRLDVEYAEIQSMESHLSAALARLEREEVHLQEALQLASESGGERLQRQREARDNEAIERLENALLEGSSDDESDSVQDSSSVSLMGDLNHAATETTLNDVYGDN
jgi:predicted RNase H-like nuclease (RuvC/YqgF family)